MFDGGESHGDTEGEGRSELAGSNGTAPASTLHIVSVSLWNTHMVSCSRGRARAAGRKAEEVHCSWNKWPVVAPEAELPGEDVRGQG